MCDAREQCSRAAVPASACTGGQEVCLPSSLVPSPSPYVFPAASTSHSLSVPVRVACWALRVRLGVFLQLPNQGHTT